MWAVAIAVLFRFGALPNPYQMYVIGLKPPFPYPWLGLLFVSGLMIAQALIVYLVLDPETYSANWGRSLTALAIHVPVMFFFAMLSMHSPPFFGWFLIWMFVCSCVLLLAVIYSGTRAAIAGLVGRPCRVPDSAHRFSIRHLLAGVAGVAIILAIARMSLNRFHAGIAETEARLEIASDPTAP